jgi:mono/diheme cytochrome c family protein
MWRTLFGWILSLGILGLLGLFALAWRPAIAPITPPSPQSFAPALVARGEISATEGFCAECHTAKDGVKFAGGYAMATPFGVIYSTNITPDAETGIGAWSETAFARAMREGVARDGSHLFPAFPFDHFAKMSDDDVTAIYAYLMSRPQVRARAPANTIPFPLNVRAFQEAWKILFFRSGPFVPAANNSVEWNRGAYLATALSHCGACHTPRNLLGAEKTGEPYAGAVVDNWIAPALTVANPAPVPWAQDELYNYLRSSVSALHGTAAGPMAPVVHALSGVPDSDVRALATYFADLADAKDRYRSTAMQQAVARAMSYAPLGTVQEFDRDARLYAAACGSCHYNSGAAPLAARPELALNSAVNLDDPTNLIQVVLHGISANDGMPGAVMPGFAGALSDADIVRIAAYLRRTRTTLPQWPDLDRKIAELRNAIAASP